MAVMPLVVQAQQESTTADHEEVQTEELVLQMPVSWHRLPDPDTIVTLVAPPSSLTETFRENIRVKKYPLRGFNDLDRILAVQKRSIESPYKLLGSGILSDGEPRIGWLATAEKEPSRDLPLCKVDYMIINQKYLYVLHAMCQTSKLDKIRPTFDAIAQSIRFTQPSPPQQDTSPPKQQAVPPQQSTTPPQQSTTPPQQSTTPPQQSTTPPQQNTAPPRQDISPNNSPRRSEAYKQGQEVGRYTVYAMMAAVVVWFGIRVAKSLLK